MTEAIVLVGGMGTRLRPLTESVPKPLLPVAGIPFLEHQFRRLGEAGIERVVLATSYRSELFAETFGDGRRLGLDLVYVTEDSPRGTGGAIRNVADHLTGGADDPVVVLNGDILSGHDLVAQLDLHRSAAADVTLHLVQVADARAFGCVPTDEQGRVTAFLEKMPEPVTDQVNAGCYVFRRSVIDDIPAGRAVSVERETFPGLLDSGAAVHAYLETAYWLDLGTPSSYVRGSADLVLGNVTGGPGAQALVLDGATVAPGARIVGGSTIGSGAVVEDGALVEGSILLDGAVVRADARVVDSVIGAEAQVGRRCLVHGSVIGDRAVVGADNELCGGARLWTDQPLAPGALRFSGTAG